VDLGKVCILLTPQANRSDPGRPWTTAAPGERSPRRGAAGPGRTGRSRRGGRGAHPMPAEHLSYTPSIYTQSIQSGGRTGAVALETDWPAHGSDRDGPRGAQRVPHTRPAAVGPPRDDHPEAREGEQARTAPRLRAVGLRGHRADELRDLPQDHLGQSPEPPRGAQRDDRDPR